VLGMQKKFPKIRSAINIRYDESLIKKCAKNKFKIASYDRNTEPESSKARENSSISWGVSRAIKKLSTPPDIIYHKGDFGKEPMIIVFGINPSNVIDKISKIL
jgi:hydroxymethylpyrimidine/phosphomethylpyrimidine kinase